LRTWTPPIVAGVCGGGLIAAVAPAWVFKLAFIVVSVLLAARMFFVSGAWRLGDTLPGYPVMLAHGLVIGLYASLMGVGGGAYATLVLTLYGATIHAAIGISAGIGVVISTVGTVVYAIAGMGHQQWLPSLAVGYVWLPGVALMAPASALAARYGARVAHAMAKRRLEVAFGWYMIAVALRFAYDFF
jgi:uncharacterized membrane protein YfcA